MKKNLLLLPAALLLLTGNAFSQNSVKVSKGSKMMSKVSLKTSKHANAIEYNAANLIQNINKSVTVTSIGTTTYQLQTNYSIQDRIVRNSDNTISTAYTYSTTSGSFSDRGTGYVYHNGTSWSAVPTARIETDRNGWPALMVLGSGGEAIITHNTVQSNLQFTNRATKGSGAWTENTSAIASAAPLGNFWPRAAVGGTTNNTIHCISISNPIDAAAGNAPVYYLGQQGCLTYCRSQDGGVTWDQLHVVPAAHDSTQYDGFSADCYAIAAKGNTVAYVVGGSTSDLFLMKSTDNGSTWTKTVILTFPIPFFNDQLTDINGDSVIDTIDTNDGSVAILLDNSGNAHVWFGNMRIMNDDSTDAQYSYFPGTDGLNYWNETSATITTIAGIEDINGDMTITFPAAGAAWGTYQCALTGQPHAAIDATGNLYLTYASIVENTDLNAKAARNIYFSYSSDGGANWLAGQRVNADDFNEQVYNSIAHFVDDPTCVKMIYQTDYAAGHGVTSTSADYADNTGVTAEIVYACFNPVLGISEVVNLNDGISLFPNPSNSNITITSLNTINRYEVVSVTGERVMTGNANTTSINLDINNLSSGLYMVNLFSGNQRVAKSFIKE